MAEADGIALDRAAVAAEVRQSEDALDEWLRELEALGLVVAVESDGLPPLLLYAGRQYLALDGMVDPQALAFLPRAIDDLHARRALLAGGSILVAEFRASLIAGTAVEHARDLVPIAFAPAIDLPIALDLFAATVALLVRLSDGEPAGCVAEEVIAVALIDQARSWLEMEAENGEIDRDVAEMATDRLLDLFDLFEDDDVLRLFDMREPSDAALDGHSALSRELGVVDQRIEAWFTPFGDVAPTGYLHLAHPE